MTELTNLQLFITLSFIFFVIVVAYRTVKLIKTPLQIRWEIMPIPHEKDKFKYGGSHYEDLNWWEKTKTKSKTTELFAMGEEILFIKSLYEKNRQLWWFSYPFHLGMYMLCTYLVLIVVGAVSEITGTVISASGGMFGAAIHYLTVVTGTLGLILSIIGAVGLLLKRFTRKELRLYSTPADYFNLIILLAVFVTGFASVMSGDQSFQAARGFVTGIFTFSSFETTTTAMFLHIVFTGALFIYFPFTHMIHFIAKYVSYHHVKWEDKEVAPGNDIEKQVMEQLGYKVSWSAPHIKSGGTWAEAATDIERESNGK